MKPTQTSSSLAHIKGYFGFLRMDSHFEPKAGKNTTPDFNQFSQSISLIDGNGVLHSFAVSLNRKNRIVQAYFNNKGKQGDFLYFYVQSNHDNELLDWRFITLPISIEILQPVVEQVVQLDNFIRLLELFQSIQIPALKRFCADLFNDPTRMQTFVRIAASKHHHHAYPGGLLADSVECAYITGQNLKTIQTMCRVEKELTLLAALLHDIGKVASHKQNNGFISHEKLNLLSLAHPLINLSEQWQQGAEVLQYLLTWNPKEGFCRYIGGNIIRLADHISTSLSLNQKAFANKPEYYHYSQIKVGDKLVTVSRVVG